MNEFLKTCEQAARVGGQVLVDWIGRFQSREKGDRDLVTDADLASQKEIRQILLAKYPDHAFLGEEGEPIGDARSEYRWLVDPLDGTTNYVHQIPHYCVSIALAHRQAWICGTVFDPISGECFTAAASEGAYLNGNRLRVSRTDQIGNSVVAVSFPPHVEPASREIGEFERVILACQTIRRTGSAALNLCYVAAGRFDAYWIGATQPWDVAAGVLMIREAGGIVTAPDGGPLNPDRPRLVAAATKPLHEELLRLLRGA